MHGQVRAARESVDGGLDSRDGCSGLCDDLTRFSGLARWCIGLHSLQPGLCSPTASAEGLASTPTVPVGELLFISNIVEGG